MQDLPLDGVKIIDFTTLLPGPLATLMLAEAGAEVIKVEPPEGEAMRRSGPRWGDQSALFALLNAGKSSIALDLKDEAQKARLMPLIEAADVVVEQFRPGVMERLGLGYGALAALNPRLVYCSITGYGHTGPLSDRAGHDLNYLGESGVLALNPGPPGAPHLPPLLAADIAGGSYPAVINILLALMRRERTGQGERLDVAMSENMLPFGFWALAEGEAGARWPEPGGHVFSGARARYQLYATADGAVVAVAALEDKFWAAFCEAVGLPRALRDDAAGGRATIAEVGRIIAGRDGAHWERLFGEADCCCSVIKTLEQAVRSPQFRARGLFDYRLSASGAEPIAALPLPLAPALRREAGAARRAPALGQDNGVLPDTGG